MRWWTDELWRLPVITELDFSSDNPVMAETSAALQVLTEQPSTRLLTRRPLHLLEFLKTKPKDCL